MTLYYGTDVCGGGGVYEDPDECGKGKEREKGARDPDRRAPAPIAQAAQARLSDAAALLRAITTKP